MKILTLLEIIDTSQRSISTKNLFKKRRDDNVYKRKMANSSVGGYGRVYNHNKDNPFTLIKKPHFAASNDAYQIYIKYIVDNKLFNTNPFFPRVYKFDTVHDSTNRSKYRAEIETLQSFEVLDDDIIFNMIESLFDSDVIDSFLNDNSYGNSREEIIKYRCSNDALCELLSNCILYGIRSLNGKLNEAFQIIKHLLTSERKTLDLHSNNVMIRLSPYPQLVLVDPLC